MIIITISREDIEAKRRELSDHGVLLTTDSGTISHSGVQVSYAYSEPECKLSIRVLKHPFYISESFAEKKIKEWFGGEGDA